MEGECLALKDLSSPRTNHGGGDGGPSDHKENIFTPLKAADAAALLVNRRGGGADLTQITPVKRGALAEPWTPTANLKMLISAASPDIRDREMKKVLFRPIENDKDQTPRPDAAAAVEEEEEEDEADDHAQLEAADEDDDVEKKPSRKQKSLGLLCQKFLALYPDHTPHHDPVRISLDEVAANLGVERRRIYDIVNVLESLMIVGRIAKNSYTWYGRRRLEATLQELQRRGLQQGYHLQMAPGGEVGGATPGRDDDGAEGGAGSAGSNRKDKSLRIMSQKFVMLFLVSRTQTVTLDAAAKVLIEEGRDSSSHSKYKTKVRRLYDIANVLTSLGLIKKVHVREERGRKPAFKWLGPVDFSGAGTAGTAGEALNVAAVAAPGSAQDLRRTMSRHASFSVTATAAAAQRQVSSAPSSPRPQLMTGLTNQPLDYSRKTLQFGNTENLPIMHLQPAFAPSSSPSPHLAPPPSSHCLAYLPSVSQPSLVMLYRPPEGRKRRREEEEEREEEREEEEVKRKKGSHKTRAEPQQEVDCSECWAAPLGEASGASHYLYVPNNAGLNSLNFLLPAGQPAAAGGGVALPPTLALPCVLVASPSLSHYPLLGGGGSDAGLSFGVPAMMSPGHFVVGASPYGLTAELPPGSAPSSPKRRRVYGAGAAAGTPRPPNTPEPLTPHTPKEAGSSSSSSQAFFQTPGTLGGVASAAPAARRRASAQRRLDVGHAPSRLDVSPN